MSSLTHLWDRIDEALESHASEVIIDAFNQAMLHGDEEGDARHEFYYAAGYVAYMHPEGKLNACVRMQAARAFLLSLLYNTGFLPSVLYLAFIKMDEAKFMDALELLYSFDKKIDAYGEQLIDRYFEATICCLIECDFWVEALRELKWFDRRMKEDAHVGIDLINFMKIIEKVDPVKEIERNVINKIRVVLSDRN